MAIAIAEKLAGCHPKLSRGVLWCRTCNRPVYGVNFAECFRNGWPRCCGETMTIDSPKERGVPMPVAEPSSPPKQSQEGEG